MLWWRVNKCIQTAISKTTTNMTQFASTLALQHCSHGQFNYDTRIKWAESLNTIIHQFTTDMLTCRQGVWRASVNRDSLWNLERNDHFPPKKTLNRFYEWTKGPKQRHHNSFSQNSSIWDHKINNISWPLIQWECSIEPWHSSLPLLNLIHVQYCDIMRFMVLHNRQQSVTKCPVLYALQNCYYFVKD